MLVASLVNLFLLWQVLTLPALVKRASHIKGAIVMKIEEGKEKSVVSPFGVSVEHPAWIVTLSDGSVWSLNKDAEKPKIGKDLDGNGITPHRIK